MNDLTPNNPIFTKILKKIKQDPRILAVEVFGSYIRKEYYRDIDLCLFTFPNLDNTAILLDYLDQFPKPYDISIFQLLPLYIRSNVIKEGTILLNKNYDLLFEIHMDTIKDFNLFEPHYRTFLEAVLHGK